MITKYKMIQHKLCLQINATIDCYHILTENRLLIMHNGISLARNTCAIRGRKKSVVCQRIMKTTCLLDLDINVLRINLARQTDRIHYYMFAWLLGMLYLYSYPSGLQDVYCVWYKITNSVFCKYIHTYIQWAFIGRHFI